MKRRKLAENNLNRYARRAVLAACLVTTLPALGCRSGRPSWNMFSRSEPSASTLAGSGPTTTYPTPPSSRATPEAIASIAGGTAPKQPSSPSAPAAPQAPGGSNPYALAGNRVNSPGSGIPTGFPTGNPSQATNKTGTPGNPTPSTSFAAGNKPVPPAYALPGRSGSAKKTPTAGVPNYAAAAANGYAAPAPPPGTQPAPPSAPPAATELPSGYQLGSKTPSVSSTAEPSESGSSQAAGKNDFEMPPLNANAPSRIAADSSDSDRSSPGSSGGFTLPSDMSSAASTPVASSPAAKPQPTPLAPTAKPDAPSPAVAALGEEPSASNASTGDSTPIAGSGDGKSPEYQTASAEGQSKSKPSSKPSSKSSDVKPAGYMPGSTSKSSGYPSSSSMIR